MSETIIQQADLFFCGGGSDKEYHAQVVDVGSGCVVRFQYGRRGSTLTSGSKTAAPVIQAEALKIFSKLVSEKTSKGYQTGAAQGGSYVSAAPTAPVDTSDRLIPQLLNMIDESEVDRFLHDDAWGMQEKKDGKHQMLRCSALRAMTAYNKKGKEIGYPKQWLADLYSDDTILDGEAIDDTLHVFDLLQVQGEDYRGRGYGVRHAKLSGMSFGSSIRIVPMAVGYAAKKALYDRLVREKKEGVVFKRLTSVYTPGRPASGGEMVKFKFYSTASVRVCAGRSGKHSVGLEILDGSRWVGIGNVTVGQSTALPKPGTIAEIRYLYAYPGGSLYQPTYLGPRDDVDAEECVTGQLKYKSSEE